MPVWPFPSARSAAPMPAKSAAPVAMWLCLSAALVALDQFTKQLVSGALTFGEAVTVTPFLKIVLAHNTGAAFSFLAGAGGWQRWLFAAIAVAASVLIVVLLHRHRDDARFSLALSLILGGAIGNLIDRVRLGHVIDFIYVHVAEYYWPAFNVADSAISVGAALLVWESFRRKPGEAAARGQD